MATRILTDLKVSSLRSRPGQYEVSDPGARGLRVCVHPSGKKSYVLRFRHGGRQEKLTWVGVTLAGARKLAADAWFDLARGENPAEAKRRRREAERAAVEAVRKNTGTRARDDIATLAAEYIDKYARRETRLSTWKATERIFAKYVLPAWRGRTVHEIRRRDIINLVEGIAEGRNGSAPKPIQANRVLGVIRHFFGWLLSRDVLVSSPCAGALPPAKERQRERVLTDPEIAKLWHACGEINPRHGAFIRLLLLTAQRRSECAGLLHAELDKSTRLWNLPKERTKNGKAHVVPLSQQAWDTLAGVVSINDPALVFGKRLDFGAIKREIDAKLSFEARWTFHDLRRTAASGLQKVGTPPHVIEQVLNHRSGTYRGVVGTYQKHIHLPEMAAALQRWADHIERVAADKADDNVLPMWGR
jgi:integrase